MTIPAKYRAQAFIALGGVSVVAVSAFVVYLDYRLVAPFLDPLLWAICVSVTLSGVTRNIAKALEIHSHNSNNKKNNNNNNNDVNRKHQQAIIQPYRKLCLSIAYIIGVAVLITKLNVGMVASMCLIVSCMILMAIWVLPHLVDTRTLSAALVLVGLFLLIASVAALFSSALLQESQIFTQDVKQFVDRNKVTLDTLTHTQTLRAQVRENTAHVCDKLMSFTPSSLIFSLGGNQRAFKLCEEHLANIQDLLDTNYEAILTRAKEQLAHLGRGLAAYLAGTLSSIASMPLQLFVFVACTYYFLRYEESLSEEIFKLSPLSESETMVINKAIQEKVAKALLIQISKACVSFLTTLLALSLIAKTDVVYVFSFLSLFMELTPFTSPWMVWGPTIVWMAIRDGLVSWKYVAMTALYVLSHLGVKRVIANRIDITTQNPEVISMALIMGLHSFGAYGLLLGPLLAGITLVLLDLYKSYSNEFSTSIGWNQQEEQEKTKSILLMKTSPISAHSGCDQGHTLSGHKHKHAIDEVTREPGVKMPPAKRRHRNHQDQRNSDRNSDTTMEEELKGSDTVSSHNFNEDWDNEHDDTYLEFEGAFQEGKRNGRENNRSGSTARCNAFSPPPLPITSISSSSLGAIGGGGDGHINHIKKEVEEIRPINNDPHDLLSTSDGVDSTCSSSSPYSQSCSEFCAPDPEVAFVDHPLSPKSSILSQAFDTATISTASPSEVSVLTSSSTSSSSSSSLLSPSSKSSDSSALEIGLDFRSMHELPTHTSGSACSNVSKHSQFSSQAPAYLSLELNHPTETAKNDENEGEDAPYDPLTGLATPRSTGIQGVELDFDNMTAPTA